MYKGVYEGINIESLKKKILILGESHYSNDGNCSFTTKNVINDYKKYFCKEREYQKYQFFHKIAQSFNVNTNNIDEEFAEFWDYIYFGNYVPELCGINDGKANNYITENRTEYNNQLFDFINNENIDILFVFSRLTYKNLPSLSKKHLGKEYLQRVDNGDLMVGDEKDWIECCKYLSKVEHPYVEKTLNNDLIVYSMRHPSAKCGYRIENYSNILGELFENLKK